MNWFEAIWIWNRFNQILLGDVKSDYEISKNSGKIFVFHDIISDVCPGVVQFWNELKNNENYTYNFFEFIEQYEDVWNNTNQKFLGIGVAIKKWIFTIIYIFNN